MNTEVETQTPSFEEVREAVASAVEWIEGEAPYLKDPENIAWCDGACHILNRWLASLPEKA